MGLSALINDLNIDLILYQLLSSVKNSASQPPPEGHSPFEPYTPLGSLRDTQSELSDLQSTGASNDLISVNQVGIRGGSTMHISSHRANVMRNCMHR